MCANRFPVTAQPGNRGDPSGLLEQAANARRTESAPDHERSDHFWTGLKKGRHKHLDPQVLSSGTAVENIPVPVDNECGRRDPLHTAHTEPGKNLRDPAKSR